jgi:hypothetical protein
LLLLLLLQMEKSRRDELAREKDALQGQVAELGGMVKSQERLLELEKVGQQRCCCCLCASHMRCGWGRLAAVLRGTGS